MIIFKKKSISTFDCSTLYTTTLHKFLLEVLSEVINFFFKSTVRKCIGFSIFWSSRGAGRRCFTKQTLVNAKYFLINKLFVILLVKQLLNKILVYQLVFWTNLFLHFFESKYVKQLIFNGSSVNNENEFLKLFKNIYPKAFLDLEIKIEDYFRKRSVSQKGYISIIYSPNGSSGSISSEPF